MVECGKYIDAIPSTLVHWFFWQTHLEVWGWELSNKIHSLIFIGYREDRGAQEESGEIKEDGTPFDSVQFSQIF